MLPSTLQTLKRCEETAYRQIRVRGDYGGRKRSNQNCVAEGLLRMGFGVCWKGRSGKKSRYVELLFSASFEAQTGDFLDHSALVYRFCKFF